MFFLLFFQMGNDFVRKPPERAVLCVTGERHTYKSPCIKETDVYL